MSLEEKYQIVRSIGEECIQEDELLNLLEKKPEPVCYDGFEPSGRMHIAQVLLSFLVFYFFVFLFFWGVSWLLKNLLDCLKELEAMGEKKYLL